METCLAGARRVARRRGPLVLERGPATNPLFGAFFEAVQQAGYPLDRRRQRLPAGGLRPVRPQHPPRPPAVGGPRVPAPGDGPAEPRPSRTRRFVTRVRLRRHPRGRRRVRARRRRRRSARSAGEVVLCGGAINTPQLLQLSGVGDADELRALGIDVVARRAGRGREPAGPPRGLHPVRLQAAGLDRAGGCDVRAGPSIGFEWLFLPQGPRRDEPLRGRRLRAAATTTSTTPT